MSTLGQFSQLGRWHERHQILQCKEFNFMKLDFGIKLPCEIKFHGFLLDFVSSHNIPTAAYMNGNFQARKIWVPFSYVYKINLEIPYMAKCWQMWGMVVSLPKFNVTKICLWNNYLECRAEVICPNLLLPKVWLAYIHQNFIPTIFHHAQYCQH